MKKIIIRGDKRWHIQFLNTKNLLHIIFSGDTNSFKINIQDDGIIEYQKNNFNDECLKSAYYKLKLN